MTVRIVLTVGSDHHPFDRVVRWVDSWSQRHPSAEVWVQHGTSNPPSHATGVAFTAHDVLMGHVREATAVITAAGPGTVMEIREAGLRPIVVPRRSALEEHVDDHQRAFARRLHEQGLAVTCEREADLRRELDACLDDPQRYRIATVHTGEAPGRTRAAALFDALLDERGA